MTSKPLHGQAGGDLMGHASRLCPATSAALRLQTQASSLIVVLLVILIFFVLHILRTNHPLSSSSRQNLCFCEPGGHQTPSQLQSGKDELYIRCGRC